MARSHRAHLVFGLNDLSSHYCITDIKEALTTGTNLASTAGYSACFQLVGQFLVARPVLFISSQNGPRLLIRSGIANCIAILFRDNVPVMFSGDQTGDVAYFGLWAETATERQMLTYALSILADASTRSMEQDMRTADVRQALSYLERTITRPALIARFRTSLSIADPMQRARAVREAYDRLRRALGV